MNSKHEIFFFDARLIDTSFRFLGGSRTESSDVWFQEFKSKTLSFSPPFLNYWTLESEA